MRYPESGGWSSGKEHTPTVYTNTRTVNLVMGPCGEVFTKAPVCVQHSNVTRLAYIDFIKPELSVDKIILAWRSISIISYDLHQLMQFDGIRR